MKQLNRFYIYAISIIFLSCIEEYKLPTDKTLDFESNLVIQGQILSGDNTYIFISRTQPIANTLKEEIIENAEIKLIGENGYISQKASFNEENGRYVIPSHNLQADTQYALEIKLDGEIYQSEFQHIYTTPEITDVHYEEQENGISLYVSTQGTVNGPKYYMWTYDEDWEFHAEMDISKKVDGEWYYDNTYYPLLKEEEHNPYLYCWGHNESSQIHIYTTENLSANEVKNQEFLYIPNDDIRISYLYSILVKQACLNEKGYEYYRLMKLYTQESSGIFTPIPGMVKGNVKCVSNSNIQVYGYVMASNITTKRIFIYESDFQKTRSQYANCVSKLGSEEPTTIAGGWRRGWEKEVEVNAAVIYNKKPGIIDESSIIYTRACVDCTANNKSTKKRPDFWPNNHE